MNTTQLYIENKNTIQQKSKQIARRTSFVEAEEIESQANLIFMKCINRYDSSKGASFPTYFSRTLDKELPRYLIFFLLDWEQLHPHLSYDPELIESANFSYWIKSMSEKTQKLINTILHFPISEISSPKTGRITKQSLRNYLRSELGWKTTEIRNCFNEIEIALERI